MRVSVFVGTKEGCGEVRFLPPTRMPGVPLEGTLPVGGESGGTRVDDRTRVSGTEVSDL